MNFTNSKRFYFFICVIIIFQSKMLLGSAVLNTDFELYDIDVKLNKFSQVISATSKITCCNRCARTTGCASVSFNADEKMCLLGEEETLDVSATNGWKTYIDTADDCIPEPCLNGATCTDALGTFTCTCAVGWQGQLCESVTDYCSPNPCINGVCSNADGTYMCNCYPGYGGNECETGLDCDAGWYYFDYSCYLFVDSEETWMTSKCTMWKWSTKTEIHNGYTNWDIDQPDDGNGLFPGGEDCGNLRPWSDFKWNDERCNLERVSICEKEIDLD